MLFKEDDRWWEQEWRDQANCRTLPDKWFIGPSPDEDTKRRNLGLTLKEMRRARMACERCPVIRECDDEILRQPVADRFGVWAGVWYFRGQESKHTPRMIERREQTDERSDIFDHRRTTSESDRTVPRSLVRKHEG